MIDAWYFPLLALMVTTFTIMSTIGIVGSLLAGRDCAGIGGTLIIILGLATAGSYVYMVASDKEPAYYSDYQCTGAPYETC